MKATGTTLNGLELRSVEKELGWQSVVASLSTLTLKHKVVQCARTDQWTLLVKISDRAHTGMHVPPTVDHS